MSTISALAGSRAGRRHRHLGGRRRRRPSQSHWVDGWELWRDVALRSAGFPVSGLEAFGSGDESARLRGVARDPLFREAVTWQNPAVMANAIAKVADGASGKPSRVRQREEVVASYWQRYCAKNDTIGFFGPLAWGRLVDDGPPHLGACPAR